MQETSVVSCYTFEQHKLQSLQNVHFGDLGLRLLVQTLPVRRHASNPVRVPRLAANRSRLPSDAPSRLRPWLI